MAERAFLASALIRTCDRTELDRVQLAWDNIEFPTVMLGVFDCNTGWAVSAINPWIYEFWDEMRECPPFPGAGPGLCWGFPSAAEGMELKLGGTSKEKDFLSWSQ